MTNPELPTNVYPLVLLGGGHTHALWLKYWQQLAPSHSEKRIRPLLISENSTSPYSGMLPGLLSGENGFDDCHIDLAALCEMSNCDFLKRSCINIQKIDNSDYETLYRLDFKALNSEQGDVKESLSIFCQTLSINIGSQPFSLASDSKKLNSDKTIWKVKPISEFFQNWTSLQQALNKAETHQNSVYKKPIISIVGAGAAGVEIACAIKLAQKNCHVQLFSRSINPLPSFHPKVQQHCLKRLIKMDIDFIGQEHAEGKSSDFTILCTQSSAPSWLKNTTLALSEDGFIAVDENLQSSCAGIFAAGDCIHFTPQPLPKAGVFAVRQAKALFNNLCAQFTSAELQPYKPQTSFLSIINMGDQYALAQRGRWSIQGRWPWCYKHFVDRKFMMQFKPPLL